MFIGKRDYLLWLDNTEEPYLNKMMIETFPFLLPRNRWTGKVSEQFDYTYNEMSSMPYGWAKAFGYEMLCEIYRALVEANYLEEYRIMDIKEKYGMLRWYDGGAPKPVFETIIQYINKSAHVCQACGKPATHMTQGWIGYFCRKCGKKLGAVKIPKKWWEADFDDDGN